MIKNMKNTNKMKRKLIVLSDYGLDDAVALVHLLMHKDMFDGIDIVCVAGNCSSEVSLGNARKLLAAFKGDVSDVRIIDTTNFEQEYAHLPSIHGNDSMGDLYTDQNHPCIELLYNDEYVYSIDKNAIIFSLGPCTITDDILSKAGSRELVIMAGMVNAEPNFNGMEFNQAIDVENFNKTVKFEHVIATLDTCRHSNFNLAEFKTDNDSLLARLVAKAVQLATARHADNSYIYDFITSLYFTNRDIFEVKTAVDSWGNILNELRLKDESFMLDEYLHTILK